MKYTLKNREIEVKRMKGVNGGYFSTCYVDGKRVFSVNGRTQDECIGKEMVKLGEVEDNLFMSVDAIAKLCK